MGKIWTTCINLENRPLRRAFMETQFSALAIKSNFTDAVQAGSDVFHTQVHEKYVHANGPWGPMSQGTQACLLSHLKAYEEFLKTDAEYALVLEDDAELSRDLPDWLNDTSWIPETADIVHLEHWPSRQKVVARSDSQPYRGRLHGLLASDFLSTMSC